MGERFNLVDEHDNETGQCVWGKDVLHIPRKGIYHRSVHVFVEVYGAKFMVQLKGIGTENEGKWSSSASGHVRANESCEEAAVREAQEEIGLKILQKDLQFVAKVSPCEETGHEFAYLYTYLMDDDKEHAKPNPNEVDKLLICKLDDLIKDMDNNQDAYSPAFIVLLNLFLEIYKV